MAIETTRKRPAPGVDFVERDGVYKTFPQRDVNPELTGADMVEQATRKYAEKIGFDPDTNPLENEDRDYEDALPVLGKDAPLLMDLRNGRKRLTPKQVKVLDEEVDRKRKIRDRDFKNKGAQVEQYREFITGKVKEIEGNKAAAAKQEFDRGEDIRKRQLDRFEEPFTDSQGGVWQKGPKGQVVRRAAPPAKEKGDKQLTPKRVDIAAIYKFEGEILAATKRDTLQEFESKEIPSGAFTALNDMRRSVGMPVFKKTRVEDTGSIKEFFGGTTWKYKYEEDGVDVGESDQQDGATAMNSNGERIVTRNGRWVKGR